MTRHIPFFLILIFSLLLVIFSSAALNAARDGLTLWTATVLPALFPFFVCTSLMQRMGALNCTPKNSKILRKFGIPAQVLPMMLLSALSGAPTGARLAGVLEKDGILSPVLSTRYAAIFNFASPMFLCGALAAGMLKTPIAAIPIAIGLYGSCVLVLIVNSLCFPAMSADVIRQPKSCKEEEVRPVRALMDSLWDGTTGMLRIGASIVFFLVLTRLLEEIGVIPWIARVVSLTGVGNDTASAILTGMLEMTSGCSRIAGLDMPLRLQTALCTGIVTFGGLCLLLQSLSFHDLNAARYLSLKGLQAILAGLLAYWTAPWFLPDAVETFSPIVWEDMSQNLFSTATAAFSSLLGLAAAWLFAAGCKKRMRNRLRIR